MATNISFPTYGFVNEILALSEDNWRTFFKPFITDSVQNGLATIAGANMTVYVSAGECRCGAVMGILDEMIALDVANGDSTYDRIDSVIVQYTYGEPSTLAVAIVQGTPSANPVPPTLTKTYDTLWQMEIAQILVPSGATSSSEFTITDKRVIYESIESIIDDNTESEERVWSSQKTHEEIVSLSSEIYDSLNTKADAIERTTSGSIVSIADGVGGIPVSALSVSVDAVQDLHGQANPYPAGGGKNLFAGYTEKTYISPNTEYRLSSGTLSSASRIRFAVYDAQDTLLTPTIPTGVNFYVDGNSYLRMAVNATQLNQKFEVSNADVSYVIAIDDTQTSLHYEKYPNIQLELGSLATTYAPYENVCPIMGWTGCNVTRTGKNLALLSSTTIQKPSWYSGNWLGTSLNSNNGISQTRGYPDSGAGGFCVKLKGGETYTVSWEYSGTDSCKLGVYSYNGSSMTIILGNVSVTGTGGKFSKSFTIPKDSVEVAIRPVRNDSAGGVSYDINNIQIELGSTATSYEAYLGTTLTITWQSTAGTVYGGTVDLMTGELRVTHKFFDEWNLLSRGNANNAGTGRVFQRDTSALSFDTDGTISNYLTPDTAHSIWENLQAGSFHAFTGRIVICTEDPNDDKTSMQQWVSDNGIQLLMPLKTPLSYTLTPAQTLSLLLGLNHIWADTGDILNLTYPVKSKLFIDEQIAESQIKTRQMITIVTDKMIAPDNLNINDIIVVNDELYKVINSNIASGEAMVIGTNVIKITLAEYIQSLL